MNKGLFEQVQEGFIHTYNGKIILSDVLSYFDTNKMKFRFELIRTLKNNLNKFDKDTISKLEILTKSNIDEDLNLALEIMKIYI